eukprot:scaffold218834_cov30-Prasinocladus_malaysianus.AAC.1
MQHPLAVSWQLQREDLANSVPPATPARPRLPLSSGLESRTRPVLLAGDEYEYTSATHQLLVRVFVLRTHGGTGTG